jgi:hypothetical protein
MSSYEISNDNGVGEMFVWFSGLFNDAFDYVVSDD